MHLVLCVLAGPRREGAHTAAALARAAVARGHRVSVFLAGDATAHLDALSPLRDAGVEVVACSADAAARGWDVRGAAGRGSFVDLGDMAASAGRILVLR